MINLKRKQKGMQDGTEGRYVLVFVLVLPSISDNNLEHFPYVFFLDNVFFAPMENRVLNKYHNNHNNISA